jgi:hypothetical protein
MRNLGIEGVTVYSRDPGSKDADWIVLAQDSLKWRFAMYRVVNLWIP